MNNTLLYFNNPNDYNHNDDHSDEESLETTEKPHPMARDVRGEKNPMYGRRHTNDTRQ
jgi:hypothetical protein